MEIDPNSQEEESRRIDLDSEIPEGDQAIEESEEMQDPDDILDGLLEL